MTLTRDSVVRETRRCFGRLLRTFDTLAPGLSSGSPIGRALSIMVLALPVLSTHAGDFDGVPQVLLFFVLTLLKRLETLMLQLPICDDHPEYTVLFEKLAKSQESEGGSEDELPFQNIKTLLLQGDPELLEHFESDDCSCEVPEVWGCQARDYWPVYDAFPNLNRIQHLYLHNSIACPRNLNQVLKNAPSLRTLYMTPRREDDFDHGPGGDLTHAHPEALDVALLERPKKLRHLDVAWFDCRGYESLIGPEGRLSAIAELVHLEKLCIQLCVLYGNSPANLLTPLVDLLPPSLVELALEEWWWDDVDTYDDMEDWIATEKVVHYQGKQEYRAKAVGILEKFALACPGRLPKLRKVSFLTKIPWTWTLEGYVTMQSHFDGVKGLLEGHGVEFLVDEV
ncbi:hypothetical protein QBC33DRAFT_543347 [Phialemonium atrogriseum]|uniref:Uncharacterized protein n=1 Tax=Phialemonium atrogriseum TaxID=1093897 RepID=A0AAJ0BW71_9PEZI|nr:uncharacterized protein QBC33DRAFT_543347 [Phialemonium atrogriseum]KAK1765609.1 hypothetical protein QBC33DRAFT_543347 [Phialemonium atrogriseum]